MHAIGGILKHAAGVYVLSATRRRTATSGWCQGYEAPVNLVYSSRNRSAAVRIPMYSERVSTKRLEFRSPDCSCNPYLAFSAITMAAIDGIRNKIDPGDPVDRNLYELSPEESQRIGSAPESLESALDALENDHEFLLQGNVFTADVVHYWIKYKRENEVDALRVRPHPYEFCMYFDT